MVKVVVVMLLASACSVFGMRTHDPNSSVTPKESLLPVCTDSLVPPIADGLMFLAASVLVAGDNYAKRNDRAYCGPDELGNRPIDGCGYDSSDSPAAVGVPLALIAVGSAVVGVNRHAECHAAYDAAEGRTPIARFRTPTGTKVAVAASLVADLVLAALGASLFAR